MKRYYLKILLKLSIIFFITACGSSGGGDNKTDNPPETNTSVIDNNTTLNDEENISAVVAMENIQGVVQKGLFIDGKITICYIDDRGNLSDINKTSQIDSHGSYELYIEKDALLSLEAKGHFFNEYTEKNSTNEVTLHALVDFKKSDELQQINLNFFTSLEHGRVLTLMGEGKSYTQALESARNSMQKEFGLNKSTQTTKLNIYDLNGTLKDENLNLLLLSGAFLKSVDEASSTSQKSKTTQYEKPFSDDDFGKFVGKFQNNGVMSGTAWQKMQRYDMDDLLKKISPALGLGSVGGIQPFAWVHVTHRGGTGEYNDENPSRPQNGDINQNLSTLPVAQKGPFIQNKAKVTAYPLSSNGVRDRSQKVEAEIVDLQGAYNIQTPLPWNGLTELVVLGKYYDEITGEESEDNIELSVVVNSLDINSTYPNINILTDMEARRVKKCLNPSLLFAYRTCKAFAHLNLANYFNIEESIDFAKLNLLNSHGENREQNAELLRLSSAILKTSSIMAGSSPKDILNAISDDLYDYGGIEKSATILKFDMIKDYAKDGEVLTHASEKLKLFSYLDFVPTQATLGSSVNDEWLHSNTKPLLENFSGDITDDMVTVFDRDIAIIDFDITDAENDDLSIVKSTFLPIEQSEGESDSYVIGFFDYLRGNQMTAFRCQDRSEVFAYLREDKSYDEIITLLAPQRGNCLKSHIASNKKFVSMPIDHNQFASSPKNEPFVHTILISDGQYIKKKEIAILFRDSVRTDALTEVTDISFDSTINGYQVTKMKPAYMPWATRWTITGKPDWATFDTTTGELSGTAPENQAGNYDIDITGYKTFSNELIAKDTESFTLKLLPTDREPDAFTIEPIRGADINSMVSQNIVISGISQGALLTLNGEDVLYQINGGILLEEDREVHNGDTITFTMRSPANYSETRDVTITIGGVSSTWSVTTRANPSTVDTTPDVFHFTQLNNVDFLTMQQASVKITGINANTQITISNGEYSLDKGATWTTADGTIVADSNFIEQTVLVRHLSGDDYGVLTQTNLMVGSIGASFNSKVKTSGAKATPPSLTPTQLEYFMDDDFTINFPTNAEWKGGVTNVNLVGSLMVIQSADGIALVEGTDYTLYNNKLVIHSQALRTRLGNVVDDFVGSWNIVIKATGYEEAYTIFEVRDGKPFITSSRNINTPENQKDVTTITAIARSNITFHIATGYDGDKFTLNILTGELKFKVAPDYETPLDFDGNNIYQIRVEVKDTSNVSTIETIYITVTDVDETPSPTPTVAPDLIDSKDTGNSTTDNITKLNADLTYAVPCPQKDAIMRLYFNGNWYNNSHVCEGDGIEQIVVPLTADGKLMRVNYTQQLTSTTPESAYSPTLRVTVDSVKPKNLPMADLQDASDTGSSQTDNLTSVRKPTFDIKCDGIDSVIEMWVNSTLVMTACTSADRDSILVHNSLADGSYQVTYHIIDIAGNKSDASPSMHIVVDGTAPTAPTLTSPTNGAIVEGTAEAGTTITATTPTSSCTTTVDANGDYSCTLTPAPINFESVEVIATDDAGNTSPKVTGEIQGVTTNHPPVITSGTAFTFYEGEALNVVAANVNADDPDADLITYSIMPPHNGISFDYDKFNITENGGVLYFKTIPDYEFPINDYGDGIYEVNVKVSDGRGGEVFSWVKVTVENSVRITDTVFTPQKYANDVALDSDISIKFIGKTLTKGAGNIKIVKKQGDAEHTDFEVNVAQVVVSGDTITLNPNADFEPETEYYVLIDRGAFKDADGVNYIGITDKTEWTFTTGKAPEPGNPCDCPDFADCMAN